MDNKKIHILRTLLYINIGLVPTSFIAAIVLTIIFQTNVDYNNITSELAFMNFMSYACIVLMIIFLLAAFAISRKIRNLTHKEILKNALEEHKKKQPDEF